MRYVETFLFRTLKACIYKNKKLELNLRVLYFTNKSKYQIVINVKKKIYLKIFLFLKIHLK
jgi:hypothetical protein